MPTGVDIYQIVEANVMGGFYRGESSIYPYFRVSKFNQAVLICHHMFDVLYFLGDIPYILFQLNDMLAIPLQLVVCLINYGDESVNCMCDALITSIYSSYFLYALFYLSLCGSDE